MVSKAEWKDALQRIAGYGFGLDYLKYGVGRLSSIEDKTPRELESEIMARINGLRLYQDQVESIRDQHAKAAEEMVKAQNEARDKGFEIEDLEYQNRVLKALIWTLGFDLPVRTVVEPDDLREALEVTKDFEAEVYHDPAKNEATLTFLPKSEYRSPMEGIGWHNFESKED